MSGIHLFLEEVDMDGLCLLCKEVVSTPTDIDTVGKHIGMWLPAELSSGFSRFHESLVSHLKSGYVKFPQGGDVCLYCYVKEAYQWVSMQDRILAERFLDVFSFGFSRESFIRHVEAHEEPDAAGEGKEFGICDECGEYTDELLYREGEWVCGHCESMM